MEQVVAVARKLREEHDFRGYIHLKTIPDASDALLAEAGRYADRLSINVELPSAEGLQALAPEKDARAIRMSMGRLREKIDAAKGERRDAARAAAAQTKPLVAPKRFATGGQSTQMIVGADASDDARILSVSANLYGSYRLKRVYYSAFSPIPDASAALPLQAPPLVREHRLYQADWLMRFYGFAADEIVQRADGMLDLDVDPKLGWALTHRERFPVDVNRATTRRPAARAWPRREDGRAADRVASPSAHPARRPRAAARRAREGAAVRDARRPSAGAVGARRRAA